MNHTAYLGRVQLESIETKREYHVTLAEKDVFSETQKAPAINENMDELHFTNTKNFSSPEISLRVKIPHI